MSPISELWMFEFFLPFVSPSGKPMSRHLLRCQGFAVAYYGVTRDRLKADAASTFAQLGYKYTA
jgi:hypothetical protein